MDDEAASEKPWKVDREGSTAIHAVVLRITVAIVAIVMLLCAICSGFKLAKHSSRYIGYAGWAFCFGTLTMLFGFLFLILGLPIIADLFLNLSDKLQEEAESHKARKTKTIYEAITQITMIVFMLPLLWWAIYRGFRLATESKDDSKHYTLTVSVGIFTIIFSLVYFIIGLAMLTELGMDLLGRLQQKKKQNRHSLKLQK